MTDSMPRNQGSLSKRTGLSALAAVLIVVACAPRDVSSPVPTVTVATMSPPPTSNAHSASPSPVVPPPTSSPAAGVFAFPADAVLAFYDGAGLSCRDPEPSTKAAGWTAQTCDGMDEAGRLVVVGVVTDPDGVLGDGYASVTALPTEELLQPSDALDHLSGFLGAMLGNEAATELLPWLAGHLGDPYSATTRDEATIATYTESADDATRIYLEVAGPAYLAAPAP
jgi:hypothetical protein